MAGTDVSRRWLHVKPESVYWTAYATAIGALIAASVCIVIGYWLAPVLGVLAVASMAMVNSYSLELGYRRVPTCQTCADLPSALANLRDPGAR